MRTYPIRPNWNANYDSDILNVTHTTQRSSAHSKGLGLYQTYNLLTELLHGHIDWPDDAEGFYLVVRFPLPAEHNDSGA